jgi:hypothetical protein
LIVIMLEDLQVDQPPCKNGEDEYQ